MDRHEEAVLQLLTANGDTFVVPKYEVTAGWICPSFVALRPSKQQVWVVEVTASGYPLAVVDKINQREQKWYAPLLEQLQRLQIMGDGWSIGLLTVVRDDQIEWVKARAKNLSGVHVLSLETASCPWLWADLVWTEDMDFGLGYIPRKDGVVPVSSQPITH